ncbi:unnamed protein product [Onchocerca flexuosa]|uniref:Guanylate cyclase domain-containing protein n=1 Tax=Onchocerca flexuosa TaxID=387005 RepID=A0A183I7A0_9BILA|nr:unnamed protein product [Onchocerca flexuosa]
MYHPCIENPAVALRECNQFYCSDDLNMTELYSVMDSALNIRAQMLEQYGQNDLSRLGVLIKGPYMSLRKLYPLQAESCSYHSQLVEILGVSMVRIEYDNINEEIIIHSVTCEREFCKRCRRNVKLKEEDYCDRCSKSIAENELFHDEMDTENIFSKPSLSSGIENLNIVKIDSSVFCRGGRGGTVVTRSASNLSSHVIPDAIRVAMRAVDASTAATSATYVETMLPDEHESVFVEVCNSYCYFPE